MKSVQSPIDVRVRYSCGAYVTATVAGQRASSTSSAQQAVMVLAGKLWPAGAHTSHSLSAEGLRAGESLWRLYGEPAKDAA